MIFIGGVYVGGCDDGPTPTAPGLVPLAFDGTLRPLLEDVGALDDKLRVKSTEVKKALATSHHGDLDIFGGDSSKSTTSELQSFIALDDKDECPSGTHRN